MKKALVNIINFTFIFLLSLSITARSEIKVVTSIKPIHSLASYLMQGIGSPSLIVEGSNSPHNFTLKPSHAKMLQQACCSIFAWEGFKVKLWGELLPSTISEGEPMPCIKYEANECIGLIEVTTFISDLAVIDKESKKIKVKLIIFTNAFFIVIMLYYNRRYNITITYLSIN